MDAAVLGLLLIPDALILNQVRTFFLLKQRELLFDPLLLVLKQLLLELIDLPLLILINVVELALLKVKLTVLVHQRRQHATAIGATPKGVQRHWREHLTG